MTPETRRSTHFFWNYLHNFDIDDPNIALSLRHSLRKASSKTRRSSRRQQKVLDADPDFKLLAIRRRRRRSSHFRWAFNQRLAAEKNAGAPKLQAV